MNSLEQRVHALEHTIEELTHMVADLQKSNNRLLFKETLDKAQAALPDLSLRLDINPDFDCVLRVKIVNENGQRAMLAEQVTVIQGEEGVSPTYSYSEVVLNEDVANLIDAAMLYNSMSYKDTWIYVTAYSNKKAEENAAV